MRGARICAMWVPSDLVSPAYAHALDWTGVLRQADLSHLDCGCFSQAALSTFWGCASFLPLCRRARNRVLSAFHVLDLSLEPVVRIAQNFFRSKAQVWAPFNTDLCYAETVESVFYGVSHAAEHRMFFGSISYAHVL